MTRPIDKLKQGDPGCFGSHRDTMQDILDELGKVKKYCDQFPDSQYHITMMRRCEENLDNKIRRVISEKRLKEKGCV